MTGATTIIDLLNMPVANLFGTTVGLSAAAAGTVAFVKWLIASATKRIEHREHRVDGSTDKLISGTLSWAEDMQVWAKGVQSHLAECLGHHAACTEELAKTRAEVSELRAQLNLPGVARAMAQQVIAESKKGNPS